MHAFEKSNSAVAFWGAKLWIVLFFLAAGILSCLWIGRPGKSAKEVLQKQIGAASIVVLAVAALLGK